MTYDIAKPPCQHPTSQPACPICQRWENNPPFRERWTRLMERHQNGKANEPPKREKRPCVKPPGAGPGTEAMKITAQLNVPTCGVCKAWSEWMDRIGPDGCEQPDNFAKIVERFRQQYNRMGLAKKGETAVRSAFTSLPFKVDWADPIPGVIQEAIRRARNA